MDLLVMGVINIACFLIGAKVGQTVRRGEEVKLPNPVEAYRKHEEQKEIRKEQSKLDTIMQNIESYDGTSTGQKEVR